MVSHARERPKLTAKGATRPGPNRCGVRPLDPSARGGHTLEDVKAAADVNGSQLYHYLPGKDDLVRAVVGYQVNTAAYHQRQADFGSAEGLRAWREMLIKTVRTPKAGEVAPSGRSAGNSRKAIPKPEH
jgi:TetR/AcrR family transcriptional regulator, transcriptional repressor for nem operon